MAPIVRLLIRSTHLGTILSIYSEQWRYTGPFSRWNRFKGSFPGLGIATVAFAGYCVVEALFFSDDHHGHNDGHHDETT